MLERLMIAAIRLIADTFFRHVEVIGLDNVPADGPVIFAGNHPNALMDGWLLTARCGRWPLSFLADSKLWNYRLLVPFLTAAGAIPVYRREEHGPDADNRQAFDAVYERLESGACVGIFPEGVSHVESQLARLKTGTARVALSVAERGAVRVPIVPVGLNYIHRHRFRSQVLIEFGAPLEVGEAWLERYRDDRQGAVVELTECLAGAIRGVTLNAPDWRTLRFIQAARRLYKPSAARLTPAQYVELNRRFVRQYLDRRDDPELAALAADVEDYQARLDLLGLRDHQLRQPLAPMAAVRKIAARGMLVLLLLPLALPGAILHLPVGWIAAAVGERFSYEMDDIATLKVFATILLLPVVYVAAAVAAGIAFGAWWGVLLLVALPFSFVVSVRLVEAEAGLLVSLVSRLRILRLGREAESLGKSRAALAARIRALVDRHAAPDVERIFTADDFGAQSLADSGD